VNITPTDYFFNSTDGLSLYCAVYAARRQGGLPVLCLPGLTRNSRDFVTLAAHLSETHEVLAADLRGRADRLGSESRPLSSVDVRRRCMVAARCPSVSRVLVVGTSLGALMGMMMAAMKPERVAGVVLNDAGPEIDPAGLRRIAGYAGKLPPVGSWAEAAAQAKGVYGLALPG